MKEISFPVDLIVLILMFVLVPFNNGEVNLALNPNNKVIIVSYDGFRFDYLDKTHTPNIDKLKGTGAYARYMKPQFATKTFPNHHSIATGLYTESHGIVDNSVFDPEYGKVVSGYGAGDSEFWNFNDDVMPIWIWNELAGEGRISGVQWPGSDTPYGLNATLPTHRIPYKKSRTFETRVDLIIHWLTHPEKPANLVMMYFDEPDAQGHKYGPNSPQVVSAIERMDQVTGYLMDELKARGIFEQVNIILLSDHGFEEGSLRKVINVTSVLSPFEEFYTVYGKSPVMQLLPVEGKLEEVYEALKADSKRHSFSVFKKEDLPEKWHYGNNRRVMPLVLVADPGYVFDDYVKNLQKHSNASGGDNFNPSMIFGVHGYDSHHINMRTFFVAHGPSFKRIERTGAIDGWGSFKGLKEGFEVRPFENIDIFPLVCEILHISTPPNNGSLSTAKELLRTEFLEDKVESTYYSGRNSRSSTGRMWTEFYLTIIMLTLVSLSSFR